MITGKGLPLSFIYAVVGHADREFARLFRANIHYLQLAVAFVDDVILVIGTWPPDVPIAVVSHLRSFAASSLVGV